MKKLRDFLETYQRTRALIFVGILGIVLTFLYVLSIYSSHSTMRKISSAGLVSSADPSYLFAVEDALPYQERYVKLSGWAFLPGEDLLVVNNRFILREEATGQYYRLPTDAVTRTDVDAMFDEDELYDYDLCGIESILPRSALTGRYHVYILYQSNGRDALLDTGTTLEPEGGPSHE